MLAFKNAFVTLSLGAALVVPGAALACATPTTHNHPVASVQHVTKHDSDDKSKKVESKDHSKKVESKDETKKQDKDDHAKKVEQTDRDDKSKSCPPKASPTPKPVVSPTPVPTPVAGKGNADTGKVLAAAAAPVAVKTASTLPVTGAGTDIALAAAVTGAIAAYQLAKRRLRA